MKKVISILLFLGLVSSYIVSIDSCAKYGPDGRGCKECVSGFQLLDKTCFPKVKGCAEYNLDGECTKCEPKTFLAGNKCCDGACFQKLLRKTAENGKKYSLEQNLDKVSKVIETAENELPEDAATSLAGVDIKEQNGVERFFVLYKVQKLNTHYQRIVVDFNNKIKTPQITVVDNSFARIPQEFHIIQWKDIENVQTVLKLFPSFYATSTFTEVSAKIAVLSEFKQFQIIAISQETITIRVLYQIGAQLVILRDTQIQIKTQLPQLDSVLQGTFTPKTNLPKPTLKKVTYTGVDIEAELDVNEPLIAAVKVLEKIPNWDYTLKTVQEEEKSSDLVEFTITAQNSYSTINAELSYTRSSGAAKLVEFSQKEKTVEKSVEKTMESKPQSASKSQVVVQENGCTTHTVISGELSGEHKDLADQLLKVRDESHLSQGNSNDDTPVIGALGIGKSYRRMITTEICVNGTKEYAYVEADPGSYVEYFSYYIEYINPVTNLSMFIYTGTRSKNQSATVFSNPTKFLVESVDPSFSSYPDAQMLSKPTVFDIFKGVLTEEEAQKFQTLTLLRRSERDRNMVNAQRFAIDGVNENNETSTVTGVNFDKPPKDLTNIKTMLVNICDQSMPIYAITIGSSGPGQSKAQINQEQAQDYADKIRQNFPDKVRRTLLRDETNEK